MVFTAEYIVTDLVQGGVIKYSRVFTHSRNDPPRIAKKRVMLYSTIIRLCIKVCITPAFFTLSALLVISA